MRIVIDIAALVLTIALAAPGRAQEAAASPEAPSSSDWSSQPPPPVPLPSGQSVADSRNVAPPETPLSPEEIDQALDAHGTWVTVRGLGRVWKPDTDEVGDEFTPYLSDGTWVSTPSGWSFDSRWDWGWAAFHYGRWYMDPTEGWVWWPEYTWGPAWVDWRYGGGYVAWAPLAPLGLGLEFALGVPGWSFCPFGLFWRPWVAQYALFPRWGAHRGAWGYRDGWGWDRHPGWRKALGGSGSGHHDGYGRSAASGRGAAGRSEVYHRYGPASAATHGGIYHESRGVAPAPRYSPARGAPAPGAAPTRSTPAPTPSRSGGHSGGGGHWGARSGSGGGHPH